MKCKMFIGSVLNNDYKKRFEDKINQWFEESKIKKENIVSIKQSESDGWVMISVFYE